MTFPALEAQGVLVAEGIGAASGNTWPIKIGKPTTAPNALIAIVDAPGQSPNPKWLLDYPAIQVIVRGNPDDYPTAKAKADQVKDALLGINAFTTLAGNRWDGVTMLGDINYIGSDENSRPMFSLNFRVIREPAPSAETNREPL